MDEPRIVSYRGPHVRQFSVLRRPAPSYNGHVPLNGWERSGVALGSAFISLFNPRRADLIAALGETTATPYFIYRLRDTMLSDVTGRRILRDRPRITSNSLSSHKLRAFPYGTVGRTYADWLAIEGVSPDTRDEVKYIDDEECAYVMQRYRQCHDFYHALLGLPVFVEGEIALKAFEFANTSLPMTGLSILAAIRLKPRQRQRLWSTYLPWALTNGYTGKSIMNVYWEQQLDRSVVDLRQDLNIDQPPDMRQLRKG